MFKRQIFTHTATAILSFIILCSVQFFLLYNTYKLKNEHYSASCASCIEQAYGRSINDDKVFPGGAAILDHYILGNMDTLEKAAAQDSIAFKKLRQLITDSLITELRHKNNMDSVLEPIRKTNGPARQLMYSLDIVSISIIFHSDQYLTFYNRNEKNPYLAPELQTEWGAHIGGTLQHPDPQNLVTSLTVSSGNARSYKLTFNLFADTGARKAAIFKLMLPTFLLSLFSIFSIVLIFFLTFRNWIRQKQLSEMKSDFINSITHEFHTPLATIIIANRTLQNGKSMTSEEHIQPLSHVIQRQTDRLKMLIGRVLDITSMNKIVPDRKTLPIHPTLEEILQDYRLKQATEETDIILRKYAQPDIVLADPFWFTTIIINILDNAIKYNDKDHKEIEVTTRTVKRHIVIEIKDNGDGIDAETRKHVFEKFYRGREQLQNERKGLGLGLYYAHTAVLAHHWKIEVDSHPGQGSTFYITIPLWQGANL